MSRVRILSTIILCSLLTSVTSLGLTPDDLTFIEPTDTVGNSRVTINSNDWLLANALSSVSGTNLSAIAVDSASRNVTNDIDGAGFDFTNIGDLEVDDDIGVGSPSNSFMEARLVLQGPGYPFHLTSAILAPQAATNVHANIYSFGEDSQWVKFSANEGGHASCDIYGEFDPTDGSFNNSWSIGAIPSVSGGLFHLGKYRTSTNWGDAWDEAAIVIETDHDIIIPNGEIRMQSENVTDGFDIDVFYKTDNACYLVLEATDSAVNIVSAAGGSYGSRFDLTEVVSQADDTVVELWSFAKRTAASTGNLEFHYNTDGNPSGETPNITYFPAGGFDNHGGDIDDVGTIDATRLEGDGLFLLESAAALVDVAGQGQLWVSNSTPNQLYFVADDGTETLLGSGGGSGGGTVQDATSLTISATDEGTVATLGTKGTNSVDLQTDRVFDTDFVEGDNSSILGGYGNIIRSAQNPAVAATYTQYATIVNGDRCEIGEGILGSVIVGGNQCDIGTTSANADWGFIGGGSGNLLNSDDYGVIVGGFNNELDATGQGNVIGGGSQNMLGGAHKACVIAGGTANEISGGTIADSASTISGGENNTIASDFAVISGGQDNDILDADNDYSIIAGGQANNMANTSGSHNTILGGLLCDIAAVGFVSDTLLWGNDVDITAASASGSAGFGHDIDIAHNGCFVWKDNEAGSLTTQEADTFLIQSAGGVGVNTPNPDSALTINGAITLDEMTAPGTPAANRVVIYVDSADGDLKAKDDNGEVVVLANFAVD